MNCDEKTWELTKGQLHDQKKGHKTDNGRIVY